MELIMMLQDELDAAIREVVRRAEHPQDTNRLVAAAIRLRAAYQAAER